MISEQTIDNNVAQGMASYIDYLNNMRLVDLAANLEKILVTETENLKDLALRQAKAFGNLDLSKMEISNLIDSNRGGIKGLHGFIAESAETGIRNARDVFQGLSKSVEWINNNSHADLIVNGQGVQMKFYRDIAQELKVTAEYRDLQMMIPKSHFEALQKIMQGAKNVEVDGNELTLNKITNIRKLIEKESELRGVSFDKWLRPSINNYNQVQSNTVSQTLSDEVDSINQQANAQKRDIKSEANNDRSVAHQNAKANFGEASKAAGIGAAVQGGLNLGIFIYKKHKTGKNVWEFTINDWIEGGLTTLKGVTKGGITGYAIYGLTNVCHLAAPSAGAVTAGTFGLASAVIKLRNGEVDEDGFIDLVTVNAIDATGAAIGAAIGQTIIPIPVVGALVGSIVTTTALGLGKNVLNKHEQEILNRYQSRVDSFIENLDKEYKEKLKILLDKYRKLSELQNYSFDLDLNIQLQFVGSIELARFVGVPESNILHNENEIDDYFVN